MPVVYFLQYGYFDDVLFEASAVGLGRIYKLDVCLPPRIQGVVLARFTAIAELRRVVAGCDEVAADQ